MVSFDTETQTAVIQPAIRKRDIDGKLVTAPVLSGVPVYLPTADFVPQAGDQCIGGGYYQFDFVTNRIVLDRESWDFGRPKWHLVDVLRVPSVYRGLRIVYRYDDGFHDDFNVSDELKIEYYD